MSVVISDSDGGRKRLGESASGALEVPERIEEGRLIGRIRGLGRTLLGVPQPLEGVPI
jgi:hypothetical protein